MLRVFVVCHGWMALLAMLSQVPSRKELAVTVIAFKWPFPAVFPAVMLFELTFVPESPAAAIHRTQDLEVLASIKMLCQSLGVQDVAAAELTLALARGHLFVDAL